MTRTFTVAECCLTCEQRLDRVGRKVKCALDEIFYGERIKCSEFVRTTNNRILGAEIRMIPESAPQSKDLLDWLRKENMTVIKDNDTVKEQ